MQNEANHHRSTLGRWQLGNQSQRHAQTLQLIMGTQEELGAVVSWIAFDILDHHLCGR